MNDTCIDISAVSDGQTKVYAEDDTINVSDTQQGYGIRLSDEWKEKMDISAITDEEIDEICKF